MKCLSLVFVTIILSTVCLVNAKPFVSIGADIPIPIPSGLGSPRIPVESSGGSKSDSSTEVETMDKAESAYGYYPYYYGGWPHYGYGYHYPLVYVGK